MTDPASIYKYLDTGMGVKIFHGIVSPGYESMAGHYLSMYKIYCCLQLFLDGHVTETGVEPMSTRDVVLLQGVEVYEMAVRHLSTQVRHCPETKNEEMLIACQAWVGLLKKLTDETMKLLSNAEYTNSKYYTQFTNIKNQLESLENDISDMTIDRCLRCKKIKSKKL